MPLYGPDISRYQLGLSFSAVPADLVAIYATGGTAVGNPAMGAQVADAKANGVRCLLYHYAREIGAKGTPAQEALHFLDAVAGLDVDGYVLDWEDPESVPMTWWAKEWMDIVRAATGRTVWIYASYADLQRADYGAIHAAGYPLWEAAYVLGYQRIDGYRPPAGRAPVPYWGDPQMWQFTSSGYLPGWAGALDLNVFYGTADDWAAMHGVVPVTSTITPIQEDIMTPEQQKEIIDAIYANGDRVINDTRAQVKAARDGLPSEVWSYTNPALDGRDAYAILRESDPAQIDPVQLAAAIPEALAQRVADELGKRLSNG
jgi:GH25 family lysozyme M1 (1,4-beta-N-acetylmuramidase)